MVEDRGPSGQRWTVTGALTGTMEVWLEPMMDGVLLHYFLHAEPAGVTAHELAHHYTPTPDELALAKRSTRGLPHGNGPPDRARRAA